MIPKLKKILYASDLSDNSAPALAWAMSLAHQHDAKISFLHVIEELSPHTDHAVRSFMGEDKWAQMIESRLTEVHDEIAQRIEKFCDRVKGDMTNCPFVVNETVIRKGVPVEVILDEAASRDSDLIVMGTHGAGLLKDAMIGSTARRVLRRSRIPVFVIPLPDAD